jgi:hypothetical protein
MYRNKYGVGYGDFVPSFERDLGYQKDAHSTYVLVGAELGSRGLFLLVAMLYTCFRSTFFLKSRTDDEERCRRLLFSVLVGYLISSWMINFAYSPIFIILIACTAAFERLQRQVRVETEEAREAARIAAMEAMREADGMVLPGNAAVPDDVTGATVVASTPTDARVVGKTARTAAGMIRETLPALFGSGWKRFGVIDLLLIYAGMRVVIRVWDYIISRYLVG